MASYNKEAKKALKNYIKEKVQEQKAIKPQRKTVHFSGARTVTPTAATGLHSYNRYDLRHLYIAYGFMRGKTFKQIEPSAKIPYSETKVEGIMKNYESGLIDSDIAKVA